MPAFLADGGTSNLAIFGAVLTGAAGMAAGLAGFRKLLGVKEPAQERKIVDQPIEVTATAEYVHKAEFKELEAKVESMAERLVLTERSITEKLNEHFRILDQKRSTSIANLYRHVGDTADGLRVEIRSLPKEVIELLKNTGQLRGGTR